MLLFRGACPKLIIQLRVSLYIYDLNESIIYHNAHATRISKDYTCGFSNIELNLFLGISPSSSIAYNERKRKRANSGKGSHAQPPCRRCVSSTSRPHQLSPFQHAIRLFSTTKEPHPYATSCIPFLNLRVIWGEKAKASSPARQSSPYSNPSINQSIGQAKPVKSGQSLLSTQTFKLRPPEPAPEPSHPTEQPPHRHCYCSRRRFHLQSNTKGAQQQPGCQFAFRHRDRAFCE